MDFTWGDFRKKYMEFGGDGIYAAWKLTYQEQVFRNQIFYPKHCPVACPRYEGKVQKYTTGLCPNAERIQPKLLQLKTNYIDRKKAENAEEILYKTIRYFDGK